MLAYKDDLAYIHDSGFGHHARGSAPGILSILRRHGITRGLVVDLGCGSGIWARELSRAGYDVLGVDISDAMIRLARKKAPKAQFLRASLLRAKLPPCDAVTSIGECINYCFDCRNSYRELARFFHRVYDALRPGGIFVFDSAEPGLPPGWTGQKHVLARDWAMLREAREERGVLTRKIITFRRVGKRFRRSEEKHRLRLYRGSALLAALTRAGFRARLLHRYGSFPLPPAHVALLAQKPRSEVH